MSSAYADATHRTSAMVEMSRDSPAEVIRKVRTRRPEHAARPQPWPRFDSLPYHPRFVECLRRRMLGRQALGRQALGSLVVLSLAATPLLAREPAVRFDTGYLVSCRDVTPAEFAAANPHERLMEGRFRVTAIVEDGRCRKTTQYVYRFLNPPGRVRVVDYRPKTQQATAVAGNVRVEKKKEDSKTLGLSVSGSFESLVRGTAGYGSRF